MTGRSGLTAWQVAVLADVCQAPAGYTAIKQIADRLTRPHTTVGRALRVLSARGLVLRKPALSGGIEIWPTELGIKTHSWLSKMYRRDVESGDVVGCGMDDVGNDVVVSPEVAALQHSRQVLAAEGVSGLQRIKHQNDLLERFGGVFLDAVYHLVAAVSAYEAYGRRHGKPGPSDPHFSTRLSDFKGAVERARKGIEEFDPYLGAGDVVQSRDAASPPDPGGRLQEALTKAAAQFRYYERLHAAKPDLVKAEVNAGMARMCEAALRGMSGRGLEGESRHG